LARPEVATPLVPRGERTHLFLLATLYLGGKSVPVRVRNLSARGALIDADEIVRAGCEVTLRRGKLEARGTVRWVSHNRAGIAFETHIFVSDWLPAKPCPLRTSAELLSHSVKSGNISETEALVSAHAAKAAGTDIFAELASLHKELTGLGERLCHDMILVATHPEIQILDVACQRIARLILNISDGLHPAK